MEKPEPVFFWQWPRLLALDVPLVLLGWAWALGQNYGIVYPDYASYLMIALLVWCMAVYLRMTSHEPGGGGSSDPRWVKSLWQVMIPVLLGVGAWMGLTQVGVGIFSAFYLPMTLVCLGLVADWFRKLVSSSVVLVVRNVLFGFAFAYCCAIPGWFDYGVESPMALASSREVFLLGCLCAIWFCALDLWRFVPVGNDEDEDGRKFAVSLSLPLLALAGYACFQGVTSDSTSVRWFCFAIGTAAALLQLLNRRRWKWSPSVVISLSFPVMVLPLLLLR